MSETVTIPVSGLLLKGLYTLSDVCADLGYVQQTVERWMVHLDIKPYRIRNGTRLFTEQQAQVLRQYAREHGRWGYNRRVFE